MAFPALMSIDLGTSNTCVVYFENDEIKVIQINGERINSTNITVYNGELYFGNRARRNAARENAIAFPFVKTVIGRRRNNMKTYDRLRVPYELTDDAFPNMVIRRNGQTIAIASPQYVTALCSWEYIQNEERLKNGQVETVLTVPATYNASQIHAFREAAELAGIRVLGIIPEPIGAALRYSREINRFRYIVVYDLGGGTFDVSVIRHEVNDEYIILNSDGDPCIGGLLFDCYLFDVILEKICK